MDRIIIIINYRSELWSTRFLMKFQSFPKKTYLNITKCSAENPYLLKFYIHWIVFSIYFLG